MRVLWLSNKIFSGQDSRGTGGWLDSMAQELVRDRGITLGNIAMGGVETTKRQDCGSIRQWIVPFSETSGQDGLPNSKTVAHLTRCLEEFSPDLVHVWGTETFWGLLTARKIIRVPSLLEMQGLKYALAKVFLGGLSLNEQFACLGLREIVRPSSIWHGRKRFEKWSPFEKEIISGHDCIAVQTTWVESHVRALNTACKIFRSDLILRAPFYDSVPWQYPGSCRIFCSSAYPAPFKGLHVALRAVAILKNKLPNICLRIAGHLPIRGIRRDGYVAWLQHEAAVLGIQSNIEWLGALDAAAIVEELRSASAMLVPAYLENCSMSMQEAMILGTPVVATYTGGLPSLAEDGGSLFFPIGDAEMCAFQLERLITDGELATSISKKSIEIALSRNDPERIVSAQMDTYWQVAAGKKDQV